MFYSHPLLIINPECMRRRKAVESDRQRKGGIYVIAFTCSGKYATVFTFFRCPGLQSGRSRRWTWKGPNEKDTDVLARVVLTEKIVNGRDVL